MSISINRMKGASQHTVLFYLAFAIFFLLSQSVLAKNIGLFYHHEFVDIEQGSVFSEASNLKASLEYLGHQVILFGDFETLDKTDIDLIIIPELEHQSLIEFRTSAQLELYKDYVEHGGGVIVMGVVSTTSSNNKNGVEFINYVCNTQLQTGGAVLEGSCTKNINIPNNEFSDAPDVIDNNNSVVYLTNGFSEGSSLIYHKDDNPDEIAVAQFPKGKGSVVYFGWGWWNAFPVGTQDGGWLDLLESSINTLTCDTPKLEIEPVYTFELDATGLFELSSDYFSDDYTACSDVIITLSKSTFTCDDLYRLHEIEVIVTDELDRTASSFTTIEILDTESFCLTPLQGFQITGKVTNGIGAPIEDVEVILESEFPQYLVSNVNGVFGTQDLVQGKHELHIDKDDVRAREVSTSDIRQINRHLLGLEKFTSPYQYIAADMNGDMIIDVKDLLIVKKLLLHIDITEQLPANWHWISSDFEFVAGKSPLIQKWDTLQASEIDLENNNIQVIGIKSGDVDFSY